MRKLAVFSALCLTFLAPAYAGPTAKAKPVTRKVKIRHVDANHTDIVIQDFRPRHKRAAARVTEVSAVPRPVPAAPALQGATPFQEMQLQAPRLEPGGRNQQEAPVTYSQTFAPGPSQGAAANGYSLGTPAAMVGSTYGYGYGYGYGFGNYWDGNYGYNNYCGGGGGYYPGPINQNTFLVPQRFTDPRPGEHPYSIYAPSVGPQGGYGPHGGGHGGHHRR